MNNSMATKHLSTDLPNSLPGPRYLMFLASLMSSQSTTLLLPETRKKGLLWPHSGVS